jgi:WD40 repeat protein
MGWTKDDLLRGQFGEQAGANEVLAVLVRRSCRALWRLTVVGLVITGCAVVLSVDLSEPGQDASRPSSVTEPTTRIEAVAFAPDGRTIASCGWDTSVRVWNVGCEDGSRSREPIYLNHDSPRVAMAFSPDGRYLATSGEGSLAVWSRESGAYKPLFEKIGLTFRCLAFSPDCETLALGGDDGAVRLWDSSRWRERAILLVHNDVVRCVAFSPDSRRLVSSGEDRSVMLWDAVRGVAIRQLARPGTNPVQLAAFSPDGKTIAIGEISGFPYDVGLVDPETGAIRAKLAGHEGGICTMAFSPDGRTLATAGVDGCIKLWNLSSGKQRQTISDHVGRVRALAFSPNGAQLAFADIDENLRLLDLKPKGIRLFSRVLTKDASRPGSTFLWPIHS